MDNNTKQYVKYCKEQNIRRKRYKRVLRVLSCLVVFCTFYAFILPAITMERTAPKELVCSYETINVHSHSEACYDQDRNIICGYADYIVHTHGPQCYNDENELLCGLQEIESHVHDDMCYETISVTSLEDTLEDDVIDEDTAIDQQTPVDQETVDAVSEVKLVCEKKEIVIHKHDGNCFDIDGNLICENLEILEHSHIDTCFREVDETSDENVAVYISKANINLLADIPADAVYVKTQNELQNAINNGSSYIALSGNFGVYIKDDENDRYGNLQDSLVISNRKNITLDLNGYTLWHHGSDCLFEIEANSTLNIVDSKASAETVEYLDGNVVANRGTTKESNGKVSLTYFVTNSKVTNDAKGATTETLEKHTVTSKGTIVSNDQVTFNVRGGTLNIQSGMIYGGTNHAIEQSSGTTNVTGGYICGFTTEKDGAAVYTTGGTFNIDEHGVVAVNSGLRGGGGFHVNTDVNIKGGVIASNISSRTESSSENGSHYGGAGVYIDNGRFDMEGGYITNNYVESKGYFDGGGGILACGNCKVSIKGGYITGNEASSGGGIRTNWKNAVEIEITGGYICSNVARTSEGGGVSVNMNATGVITGGYINNNATNTPSDWGGGGVFCSTGSWLYVRNALITDNYAGGFGGGVAGCSTGRTYLFVKEGAALYDNSAAGVNMSGSTSTKNEDHEYASNNEVFMNNGYQDYFCALNSIVEGSMLGGQPAGWHGSADGVPVRATGNDTLVAAYIMGLSSEPTEQGKLAAQGEAKVYLNGNSSFTHGGGILCNGYMIVGETDNIDLGARIELKAYKEYLSDNLAKLELKEGQFTFEVVDAKTDAVIATATNDSKGAINFKERLAFTEDGQYVYYIREVKGDDAKISYDGTVYRLTVDVLERTSFFDEVLINGETITITKTEYLLDKITIEKKNGLDSWETVSVNENPANSDSSAITLELTSTSTFTNINQSKKSIKVIKQWEDNNSNNRPRSVTVDLLQNGQVYDTVTLNNSNNWQYIWSDLESIDSSDKEYKYTVKEQPINGYVTEYVEMTENTLAGYWVPAKSIVEGSKYIIVSPNYDYALYVTDAKANAGFSSNEKSSITAEKLTFNGSTYEKAIPESMISARNIFRAESTKSNSNERLVFKNLGTKDSSWLLAQSADSNYLKGTSGISYSSGVKLENKRIKIQKDWDTNNSWRYLSYDGSKFTTRENVTNDNAAILYEYMETSVNSLTTYTIINKAIDTVDFSINITKVSEFDSKMTLAGAEFNLMTSSNEEPLYFVLTSPGVYSLSDSNTNGATQTLVTNSNGKLVLQGLKAAKYILRETKAPNGYQTIEDLTVTLGVEDENGDIPLVVRKTIEDSVIHYKLPETGGPGTTLYTIGGALIIVLAVVLLWYSHRKKELL